MDKQAIDNVVLDEEAAHMDNQATDIVVLDKGDVLCRPWLVYEVDIYSRMITKVRILLEPDDVCDPSYCRENPSVCQDDHTDGED